MDLDELRSFVALADAGSLTGAAETSGVPRSTLRRRLRALEERLNCPLFNTDGRRLVPTQRGREVEQMARRLLMHADAMEATIRGTRFMPERSIVVIVQTGMSPALVYAVARFLRAQNPAFRFEIRARSDTLAALVNEGDLAVALNVDIPDDGYWITRKLGEVPMRLRASEQYLAARGAPTSLEDLANHDVITCSTVTPANALPLRAGGTFPVSPIAVADDISFCHHGASSGYGIALAPPMQSGGSALRTVLEEVVGVDVVCRVFAPGGLSSRPQVATLVRGMIDVAAQLEL